MNVHTSSCKVSVILSDLNETWILLTVVRKIIRYQIPSSGSQIVPYRHRQTWQR